MTAKCAEEALDKQPHIAKNVGIASRIVCNLTNVSKIMLNPIVQCVFNSCFIQQKVTLLCYVVTWFTSNANSKCRVLIAPLAAWLVTKWPINRNRKSRKRSRKQRRIYPKNWRSTKWTFYVTSVCIRPWTRLFTTMESNVNNVGPSTPNKFD